MLPLLPQPNGHDGVGGRLRRRGRGRAVGVTELGEAVDNLAPATEGPLDRLGTPRRWGRLVASTGHRQRPGASVLAGGSEG